MSMPHLEPEMDSRRRRTTRRGFLKGAAALAGSVLAAGLVSSPDKALAREAIASPNRFGMLTDLSRCAGCRRCEAACNRENKLPAPSVSFEDESVFDQMRRPDAQAFTVVNRYDNPKGGRPIFRKVQCNHCEEPACASACLVGAMKKTPQGPVVYNENVCIGCRYCMIACPFQVPAYEYSSALDPRVRKCTMCHSRIVEGLVPACAEACPVEAITFGKREQLIALARDRIRREPDRYVDHVYGEHEVGGTGWLYISSVPFEQLDFPTDLGTTAYPEFTREFLSFVPLVLVAWPTLLGGFYLFSNRREQLARAETTDPKEETNR